MLLFAVVALLTAFNTYEETRLLLAAAVGGWALLAAGLLSRRKWARTVLGAVALEEVLLCAWAVGPYPQPLAPFRWEFAVLCAATALAAWLLFRAPFPQAFFPVRGVWLRRMLAGWCLAGILAAGPWWYGCTYFWMQQPVRWALVSGVLFGLAMLWLAGSFLVEGAPRLRLRVGAADASGAASG